MLESVTRSHPGNRDDSVARPDPARWSGSSGCTAGPLPARPPGMGAEFRLVPFGPARAHRASPVGRGRSRRDPSGHDGRPARSAPTWRPSLGDGRHPGPRGRAPGAPNPSVRDDVTSTPASRITVDGLHRAVGQRLRQDRGHRGEHRRRVGVREGAPAGQHRRRELPARARPPLVQRVGTPPPGPPMPPKTCSGHSSRAGSGRR